MLNFRKMLRTWINDPKRFFVTQFYIKIIRSYHQHINGRIGYAQGYQ